MEKIISSDFFLDSLNFVKRLSNKPITNFYLDSRKSDALIKNSLFFQLQIENVIFIFRFNYGFYNLYYYSPNEIELKKCLLKLLNIHNKLTLIIDIVTKDFNSAIIKLFQESGFNLYTSLIRMSRITGEFYIDKEPIDHNLKIANLQESLQVYEQLIGYFDPKAEQLPNRGEIIEWTEKENILVYKSDEQIAGFIIYQLIGKTLYLRYWFVTPKYRNNKIGSKLFNFFLSKGKESKRQLFWVIQTNQNAILRYKHYGFIEEKMYNFVLINRQINYEGENINNFN